jgi:hypothetical protein
MYDNIDDKLVDWCSISETEPSIGLQGPLGANNTAPEEPPPPPLTSPNTANEEPASPTTHHQPIIHH